MVVSGRTIFLSELGGLFLLTQASFLVSSSLSIYEFVFIHWWRNQEYNALKLWLHVYCFFRMEIPFHSLQFLPLLTPIPKERALKYVSHEIKTFCFCFWFFLFVFTSKLLELKSCHPFRVESVGLLEFTDFCVFKSSHNMLPTPLVIRS